MKLYTLNVEQYLENLHLTIVYNFDKVINILLMVSAYKIIAISMPVA